MEAMITMYCDQHKRALRCAEEISRINEVPQDLPARANEVRLFLAELSGILKPHLKAEDEFMYPKLLSHLDSKIAEAAKRYWDEIGQITPVVLKFLERWRAAGEIEKNSAEFAVESAQIFVALKKRIDAEEAELYPMYRTLPDFNLR